MQIFRQLCAICILFPLLTGCTAQSDQPELGFVHGQITLDGKPLAGVTVSFRPLEGGRQSSGNTNEEGLYELTYLRDIRGAKLGKHRVTIGPSDLVKSAKKQLPDRYNLKSILEAEIHSGENQCDFALKRD